VVETTQVGSPALLPARIDRLSELARNLWWCWDPRAVRLFSSLDAQAWYATEHSPIRVIRSLLSDRLAVLAGDAEFTALYDGVMGDFDSYMKSQPQAWFPTTYPQDKLLVAYFCAEFGFHESMPVYSGGLGILAGDHCKTASDLGLPFIAIGLWYTQGYFRQIIDSTGQQIAAPDHVDQADVPLQLAGANGEDVIVEVPCAGRTVFARVWRVQVGRIPVYLLDTDVEQNSPADRVLCSRLYGGDHETRIAQEVVLGVGGVLALRALGIEPTQWHMNEGHAGFMALERIREIVRDGAAPQEALRIETASTLFTTHTPVPAGNEVFSSDLVLRYLPGLPEAMGLTTPQFLALAHESGAPPGQFAMTPLAIRLSRRANGVSKLHGAVARSMWAKQFPELKVDDVPITSVTNGVHTGSWLAFELRELFTRHFGPGWMCRVDDPELWEKLATVPDEELWAAHVALKQRLIETASALQPGLPPLDPAALTIGFARRFATYKRATLFFHDAERATAILRQTNHPVQLVFAGKAHPADGGGQWLIKTLFSLTHSDGLASKVVLLPGYDISLARVLVQGVDVWLNNPERPQEASGTSGQKAALNGIPNCSIRDGWWDEGYNDKNGWAFGGEVGNDDVDSAEMYDVLENEVIPAYYDRGKDGVPTRWIAIMRESIRTCAPQFSSQRMLKEYTERLYL
jgi:starch phosphorylase